MSNAHDLPRTVVKAVPRLTAEGTVSSQALKMRFESRFSRKNCQMFSTGFNAGKRGGGGDREMLSGKVSFADGSQPAGSKI
jgi:hypothetical protein